MTCSGPWSCCGLSLDDFDFCKGWCFISEGDVWLVGLGGRTNLWPLVWNGFDGIEALLVVEEDMEASVISLYLEFGV